QFHCYFKFPNTVRNFALFEKAYIHRFSIDKRLPFHLTRENRMWLSVLLPGCEIEEISLVLESNTRDQIEFLPDLLSLVSAKRAEFILQTSICCDMLSVFGQEDFPRRLVEIGLVDIAFTVDRRYGRTESDDQQNNKMESTTHIPNELMLRLVRAGVSKLTMETGKYSGENTVGINELRNFVMNLSKSEKLVEVQMKLQDC
ncbi:hypothetical protein PFISCL1PPCAC_26438, partial [Pristionchus fissidentatus]